MVTDRQEKRRRSMNITIIETPFLFSFVLHTEDDGDH